MIHRFNNSKFNFEKNNLGELKLKNDERGKMNDANDVNIEAI